MCGLIDAPKKGVGLISSKHEFFISREVDIVERAASFVGIYFLEID